MPKLMIVAHPDDESLFGGAQLLTSNDWYVLCCTNGDNPVRSREFSECMESIRANIFCYEMLSLKDDLNEYLNPLQLKTEIMARMLLCRWDVIVTHNRQGEYGHLHHKQIHSAVALLTPNFYVFDFSPTNPELDEELWERKKALVAFYRSQDIICQGHLPNTRNESIRHAYADRQTVFT